MTLSGHGEARCGLCGGLGWILDCNDLSKPGPRMAEMIECFHPECRASGQPIQAVSFKGTPFNHASVSPLDGRIMSVSVKSERERLHVADNDQETTHG